MRRIGKFLSEVLTCPMLVVLPRVPKSGIADIVDVTLIGYPNGFHILPVAKG